MRTALNTLSGMKIKNTKALNKPQKRSDGGDLLLRVNPSLPAFTCLWQNIHGTKPVLVDDDQHWQAPTIPPSAPQC